MKPIICPKCGVGEPLSVALIGKVLAYWPVKGVDEGGHVVPSPVRYMYVDKNTFDDHTPSGTPYEFTCYRCGFDFHVDEVVSR